jgi:hypothetical protein
MRNAREGEKKPTWRNTAKVFDHVGLLVNEPPGSAGLPFTQSPDFEINSPAEPI